MSSIDENRKCISAYQAKLMKHTLGLYNADEPYRNFFYATPGHSDIPHWEILCDLNFAEKRKNEDGGFTFRVTEEGIKTVRSL